MAELVDALDSKSGFRKGVQVRFLFWAQDAETASFFYPSHQPVPPQYLYGTTASGIRFKPYR